MKIMFYSLNAAIWPHALPENRLVRELVGCGYETVYVSCGSSFPVHCTSYVALNVTTDAPRALKDKICCTCARNARILTEGSGARHIALKNFTKPEDDTTIDALMAGVTLDNYLDFQFDGVDVGRAVTYELFLTYKKMSPKLTQDEWDCYRIYLRNCLISLLGFSRIYEPERPDVVFFYSPQYGVNNVCAQYVGQRQGRVYFLEGSSSNAERYGALRVWEWKEHGLVNPALRHWDAVKDSITEEDIRRVTGHFEELFHARSFAVYSEPISNDFSLRTHFGVPAGVKIVLATLSSYDEAYAAFVIGKFPKRKVTSPVFKDQFEWIQKTIEHVTGKKDIFLIIRVHPRDYPNKRDDRQSEQAALWEKLFESKPNNVVVNWPHDKISLYDILKDIDVVVTGWSATGIEALAFGVPIVTYDRFLPSYPPDIHFTGESVSEYYANIARAMEKGRGFDQVLNAYRWLAASFSMGTVRVFPPFVVGESWRPTLPARALRKAIKVVFGTAIQRYDARRGFSAKADAERFRRLVADGAASLYDVIEKSAEVLKHGNTSSISETVRDEVSHLLKSFKIS
jgi:hypothetical protein